MWYGLSSIAAKSINYLITPFLTYSSHVTKEDFGKMGLVYSAIPILNALFTYGFETAYFRFSSKPEYKKIIYSTAALSLLFSTILFTTILWLGQNFIAQIMDLTAFPKMIQYAIFIVALDSFLRIPFAKLRQEGRPKKYAFVNIFSILVNVFFTWFFVSYCSSQLQANPNSWVGLFFDLKANPIIYVMLANLLQLVVSFFLLSSEILAIRFTFNKKLWSEMMLYALPLLVVSFGGIVNETFDRLMLNKWLPGSINYKHEQVGIYNGCYKLSLLITLFILAFKMGAEPFFFKEAEGQNPQRTYARVMKFFVIIITFIFLVVSLYLQVWQYFLGPAYRVGIAVVPILLLANMFIGVYYNLSVWYKLSNKTIAGTYITLVGVVITCTINYFFIPKYSFMASAWATFFCYGSMMIMSFIWGQREYPIPYAWKKLTAYVVIVVVIFFIHKGATMFWDNIIFNLGMAVLLTLIYARFILLVEKKEFQNLPVIGKYIK